MLIASQEFLISQIAIEQKLFFEETSSITYRSLPFLVILKKADFFPAIFYFVVVMMVINITNVN